jgi:hypothetical protein
MGDGRAGLTQCIADLLSYRPTIGDDQGRSCLRQTLCDSKSDIVGSHPGDHGSIHRSSPKEV